VQHRGPRSVQHRGLRFVVIESFKNPFERSMDDIRVDGSFFMTSLDEYIIVIVSYALLVEI